MSASKSPALSPSKQRKRQAWRERQREWVDALVADMDLIGAAVAQTAETRWREQGSGPLWSEALDIAVVKAWWKATTGMDFLGRPYCVRFMSELRKAGWVGFNTRERSLCPGRRFYAGPEVSQAGPAEVGYRAACFVSAFRDAYDQSPEWVHLAAATDEHGVALFAGPEDAEAQFRWLATCGWLSRHDDDGGLRRANPATTHTRKSAAVAVNDHDHVVVARQTREVTRPPAAREPSRA
jgi:hypothetical protein